MENCNQTSSKESVKGEFMSSSKEYLDFILEQLSELKNVTYRVMMGEYILYYGGKIVGGIYDDSNQRVWQQRLFRTLGEVG